MNPTISLATSGNFALTIPSSSSTLTHTVEIPPTLDGLRILRKILSARSSTPSARIGEDASPIREQVRLWLLEERQQRVLPKPEFDISSLDLSSLDL